MKNRLFPGCLALLLALVAICGCFWRKKEEKTLQADSKDFPNTIITSHLEEKIVPGKNIIYCSTFQLAWNELRDDIIKEDIRLADEPPMVRILNKKLTTKADISEDCYLAMAGFGKDNILAKINQALTSKFKDQAPTVVEQAFMPDSILAYAFLLKDLKFPTPFERLNKPVGFQSGSRTVKVIAFGIREYRPRKRNHTKLAKQVHILACSGEEWPQQVIVRLTSKSPKDEIILAKVKAGETLLETIHSVERTIENGYAQLLQYDDTLQIPKVDFDIKHSYSELLEKPFLNESFTGYSIIKARQDIRFRLNEKGAMLKSEARIRAECIPKRLIFDKPFLLYLKEKQAKYPYLAIWVDNPEILLKQ